MPELPRARAQLVEDLTLTNFLNKFRDYRAMDPVDNQPDPDMIAARYALTGLSRDRRIVAGINTIRDKLGPQGTLPFIRRDFDSLIGFSADIPVSNDVTYFPNPTLTRTLNKSVYVKYTYNDGEEVRRLACYVLIESTNNSYSFMSLSLSTFLDCHNCLHLSQQPPEICPVMACLMRPSRTTMHTPISCTVHTRINSFHSHTTSGPPGTPTPTTLQLR